MVGADLVTARSTAGGGGAGLIVVVTVALLLLGSGSGSLAVTSAVFVSEPAADGVTTIVTVAEFPAARSPRWATTAPPTRLAVP